jgi:hypothetical protein
MITLQLDEDQAGFLEAALEKAMDNEGDSEYYEAFDQLIGMLREEIYNA